MLNTQQLTDSLDLHGIRSHVDVRGRVWGEEVATTLDPRTLRPVDATAWVLVPTNLEGLRDWLGY